MFPILPILAQALMFANLANFQLENGKTLPECRVGYRTYGQLNADKSNAVLIPTWFGGISGDVTEYLGGYSNKLVNTSRYYVIVVDSLANGISCSPSTQKDEFRGKAFPNVSMRDMVQSQYRLLTEQLGIRRLHAVVGISMGGMQAFEWSVSHPDFARKVVTIVATPRMSAKDIKLWTSNIKLGRNPDAEAAGGPEEPPPSKTERIMGIVRAGVGNYRKIVAPFDALRQFEAMRTHDVSKPLGGSFDQAARATKADFLIYVATNDKAVSPDTPQDFAKLLGSRAKVVITDHESGHAAFKHERERLGELVNGFLDR
jgi:homoserine O-acetyltransferase